MSAHLGSKHFAGSEGRDLGTDTDPLPSSHPSSFTPIGLTEHQACFPLGPNAHGPNDLNTL